MNRSGLGLYCWMLAMAIAAVPAIGAADEHEGRGGVLEQSGEGGDDHSPQLPAILAGAEALVAIDKLLADSSQGSTSNTQSLRELSNTGPQQADSFNMSAFAIRAPIRGGWPLVVDYEHSEPGQVEVQVSVLGTPEVQRFPLPCLAGGRHHIQFRLPDDLGTDVREALVAVTARGASGGNETLADFHLYALGAGPGAVGSVAIDRLEFRPPGIHVSQGETANYQFYSKSDFDRVAVEFFRVTEVGDGSRHEYVAQQLLDEGVRPDHWIGLNEARRWNGLDKANRASLGPHRLQVRAWDSEGSWVCAWSENFVTVLQ